MNIFIKLVVTLTIFCAYLISPEAGLSGEMDEKKREFSLIKEIEKIEKGKEISIKIKDPITLNESVKLCLLLDEINTTLKDLSNIFSKVDQIMIEQFGEDGKDYKDIRSTPPFFVEGYIQDENNKIHELHGQRILVTDWKHVGGGDAVYYVYACTYTKKEESPKTIKSVNFTSFYHLRAKGLFVYHEG